MGLIFLFFEICRNAWMEGMVVKKIVFSTSLPACSNGFFPPKGFHVQLGSEL